MFTTVRKRDGREVAFDQERIFQAVLKAMKASGEGDEKDARKVADRAVKE